jgi:hypothetical protein
MYMKKNDREREKKGGGGGERERERESQFKLQSSENLKARGLKNRLYNHHLSFLQNKILAITPYLVFMI